MHSSPVILITGSLALDTIMDFPDSFRNHILSEHIHILNVGFVMRDVAQRFGGTAGNIAYTMALLGGVPRVVAPIGHDSAQYLAHLQQSDVAIRDIRILRHVRTASAYVMTDRDDNQIAAFHPGAALFAKQLSIAHAARDAQLAIIAPNDHAAMLANVRECVALRLPFVFDPGQALGTFLGSELRRVISCAAFLIGNDYELHAISEKTGWMLPALLSHVPTVIITRGAKGSIIYTRDRRIVIPVCPVRRIVDPTGAGDAYRAGFFTAFVAGVDLASCGRVGSVAAAYAVEALGTQCHHFTRHSFAARYVRTYRQAFPPAI